MAGLGSRSLRIVSIATFLPAFPLCIAHGALSHSAVPAIGLLPLAVSSGLGVFLLSRYREKKEEQQNNEGHNEEAQQEEGRSFSVEAQAATPPPEEQEQDDDTSPWHSPVLIFFLDLIVAVALMIVLVSTWIRTSTGKDNGQLAMLSAYGTLPLLVNFLIHLYLAVRALSAGLALRDLTHYLAWQVVPPDCPDCGRRLRPESPPKMPWFESVSFPKLKVPNWLKPAPQEEGYARLFVDGQETRYRDDPEHDEHGESSTRVEEPAEVEVVRKNGKGKDAFLGPEHEHDSE